MSQRISDIAKILKDSGQSAYRLDQIKTDIYQNHIFDYEKMTGLPLALRQALKEKLGDVLTLKPVHISKGAQAAKILLETRDGQQIESVMTFNNPFVCLSSMSGCNLGCQFCSTGTMGLRKKLTADEIVDQVLWFEANYGFHGHITFMGMGEPLLNCEAVFPALKILITDLKYAQRKISLSTVGIIPGIERLTKEFPQMNLAISVHCAIDEERSKLMPVNRMYPLKQVMKAVNEYIKITKRKVFLAYLLLDKVNDSPAHALALAKLIKDQGKYSYLYHVNLIQYHESLSKSGFKRSSAETLTAFGNFLAKNKIPFTIRQSFGEDIHAACGQLYAKINRP